MRIVFYLWLIFNQLPNHRPAISGVDLIINDINNPYSQQEIRQIANIVVMKNGEDITNELVLIDDEYLNNETKLGYFKQTYQITNREFDGNDYFDVIYQYVLTIYNINESIDYQEIIIKTDPLNYLSIADIINYLEEDLNLDVFKYEVTNNDYFDSGIEGDFYIELIITNRKNEKQHLRIQIASYYPSKEKTNMKYIVLGIIFSLVVLIVSVSLIKRRKRK